MQNFLKIIVVSAVFGITIIASMFALDIATVAETKEALIKTLLLLAVIALGGVVSWWVSGVRTK